MDTAGFTAEQYTASLARQNAVLQSQVSQMQKQIAAQSRELENLKTAMQDKERHYRFHLAQVDGENRELTHKLRCVCGSEGVTA
jgi:hypothetical protein